MHLRGQLHTSFASFRMTLWTYATNLWDATLVSHQRWLPDPCAPILPPNISKTTKPLTAMSVKSTTGGLSWADENPKRIRYTQPHVC